MSQKHRDGNFSIPGFSLHRNDNTDSPNTKPSYGTVVYTKLDLVQQVVCINWNIENVEVTYSLTNEPVQNLHIIGLYRSPSKVPFQDLLSALQKRCCKNITGRPSVILGDSNVDILQKSSERHRLWMQMENLRYLQMIQKTTTDYSSLLDHAYTNVKFYHSCRSS